MPFLNLVTNFVFTKLTQRPIINLQVGDVGPILDMMAVLLEGIPTNLIVARTTVSSIYRTALIVSSIPNVSNHKKASFSCDLMLTEARS